MRLGVHCFILAFMSSSSSPSAVTKVRANVRPVISSTQNNSIALRFKKADVTGREPEAHEMAMNAAATTLEIVKEISGLLKTLPTMG